jgi:hypothetical protein
LDLQGVDWLWKIVSDCPDDSIASAAVDYLLKVHFTRVSVRLKADSARLHRRFIARCYSALDQRDTKEKLSAEASAVHSHCLRQILSSLLKCNFRARTSLRRQ